MPLDPARLADIRAWLEKASLDLGTGHANLRAEPLFTGDAMFHAQQATEKALKCLLVWHDTPGLRSPWTGPTNRSRQEVGSPCAASLRLDMLRHAVDDNLAMIKVRPAKGHVE